jgi:cytochrome c oxidase subunit 2
MTNSSPLDLLPARASATADTVDLLALAVFSVVGLVTLAVIAVMLVFVARYREREGHTAGPSHDPRLVRRLEIGWTAATAAVFLGFFALGAFGYDRLYHAPARAELDILVGAKRWMWTFRHPTGRREIATLHIPAGRLVRLHLTSEDVIHSLYLPALRLKRDVVPGWVQSITFRADAPGTYAFACTEYCGTEHAQMRGELVVLDPHAYDAWLGHREGDADPLAAAGRLLFERLDCVACHETHRRHRAPPLVGLYGQSVVLDSGAVVRVDDDYVRRSILRPAEQVVAGYDGATMPSYAGLVSDDDLFLLTTYVRSIAAAEVQR